MSDRVDRVQALRYSSAAGPHNSRATRRAKTRQAAERKAIREDGR